MELWRGVGRGVRRVAGFYMREAEGISEWGHGCGAGDDVVGAVLHAGGRGNTRILARMLRRE